MRTLTDIKDKRLTLDGGPEDTVASIFHSLRERLDTLALAMGWSSSVRTFTVNSDHTQQQVWFGFSTQKNFQQHVAKPHIKVYSNNSVQVYKYLQILSG